MPFPKMQDLILYVPTVALHKVSVSDCHGSSPHQSPVGNRFIMQDHRVLS